MKPRAKRLVSAHIAANGNTVFGFSNLNNVGAKLLSVRLDDVCYRHDALDTGKLSYSIDGIQRSRWTQLPACGYPTG